jgi:hypothetical protein
MPIERGDGQYTHIRFERVPDFQPDRRTRRPPPSRVRPRSDRTAHAQSVGAEFTQANDQVAETRQRIGIDPNQLFVLEFSSLNLDIRDCVERYKAWIVDEYDERSGEDQSYRFLVQFPTETSRQLFLTDLRLYREESADQETLPPVARRKFFDALQLPIRNPISGRAHGQFGLRQEGLYPSRSPFTWMWTSGTRPTEDETRQLRRRHPGIYA